MSSSASSDYHGPKSNFVVGSLGKASHTHRVSMTIHNVYSPMDLADNSVKPNSHFASQRASKPAFVSHSRHAPLVRFAAKDEKLRSETKHIPSRPPSPYPGKRKQPIATPSSPAQTKEVSVTLVPPKLDSLDAPSR